MKDFATTTDASGNRRYKLDSRGNRITVTGADELKRRVEGLLALHLGGWFLNLNLGFPIFNEEFRKLENAHLVRAYYRDALGGLRRVAAVKDVTISYDQPGRASVKVILIDQDAEVINAG